MEGGLFVYHCCRWWLGACLTMWPPICDRWALIFSCLSRPTWSFTAENRERRGDSGLVLHVDMKFSRLDLILSLSKNILFSQMSPRGEDWCTE